MSDLAHTPTSVPADWRTVNEAAAIFGCHPMTLRTWISQGRVRAQRMGVRAIRVDVSVAPGEPVQPHLGR